LCYESATIRKSHVPPSNRPFPIGEAAENARIAFGGARAGKVYEALLGAILDHRLAPGTRLTEDEVGALFGASRTIVRAALQALAHERVVTIEPNRGAQVAEPTVEEARQVFEARSLIEPRLAMVAAGRATSADVARLNAHHAEEEEAILAGDQGRAISLSARFHNLIAEIADQRILEGFVRELTSRSSLVVALYWQRRDAMCERHAHHELIEAIAHGQGERAADLMRSHLVDILSGLNLKTARPKGASLSELLQTAPLAEVAGSAAPAAK
jgi:DNA-binding GntR family transcriptional regulator